MPRLMRGDETVAYRAVITTREEGPYILGGVREHTEYLGPYGEIGTARGMITRMQLEATWRTNGTLTVTVTGYVEKSSTTWERV